MMILYILLVITAFSFVFPYYICRDSSSTQINFTTASSTSPSFPVILTHDSEISEGYPDDDQNYYYKTLSSIDKYHVVWIAPMSPEDDHDLYLYADSSYSQLLTYSAWGAGMIDWVVFAYDQDINEYHPLVYVHPGSVGNSWVEWDVSHWAISQGQAYSENIASSDHIEIYNAFLQRSESYDFHLTVPLESDFDLYLYYMPATEPEYYTNSSNFAARSILIGNGTNEALTNFVATQTGFYLILILSKFGGGSYTLRCDLTTPSIIPGFIFTYLIIGFLSLIFILRKLHLIFKFQRRR